MADIRNLSVLPRPRSAWQAMDAGFTLARAHYGTLIVLWLGFSAPVFLLCALVQFKLGWSVMFLVWWWFKPMYELPITLYLSKALFSEQLSKRAAWKMALSHFWTLIKTYLTWARLSTARSLTFGVVFLEQLPRKKRAARIQTLTMVPTRHYVLMFVCLNIEIIFTYAIIMITTALFFSEMVAQIDWESFITASEAPNAAPWMIATTLVSLIAAALVAPFYVAGGFLVYINRRMQLEAWDIEHRFRRIKPRSATALASTAMLIFCLSTSDPTVAAERAQALSTPAEVATQVQEILAREDFGATKTRKVPRLKDRDDEEDKEKIIDESSGSSWLDWLSNSSVSSFAVFMKGLLWTLAAVFIGLLIYTVLQFKQPKRTPGSALSRTGRDAEDAKSHPLTQNLPANIADAAKHLLDRGERRQALSVLFRGALRAVMDEHDLKVSRGATESDCKQSVGSVANEHQRNTFSKLLNVWQKEAYANQPQQENVILSLIEEWQHAFSGNSKAQSDQIGDSS